MVLEKIQIGVVDLLKKIQKGVVVLEKIQTVVVALEILIG